MKNCAKDYKLNSGPTVGEAMDDAGKMKVRALEEIGCLVGCGMVRDVLEVARDVLVHVESMTGIQMDTKELVHTIEYYSDDSIYEDEIILHDFYE